MTQQLATLDFNAPGSGPAYLQAYRSSIGKNLVMGGGGRNRIGLKGNRFRLVVNGQEEGIIDENYLDLIMVGAAPGVSRIYYADAYDPGVKQPPTCYSKKGDVPEADSHVVQSESCATCPQNEKGSRVTDTGGKVKACGYFKRLAVVMPSDLTRVFQLDCKSMSIFGDSKSAQNKFSLKDFSKKLETRGVDPGHVIMRVSFDTDSSVPKLLFQPLDYISQEQAPLIAEIIDGDDVKAILEITVQTTDLSGETDLPEPVKAPVVKPTVKPTVKPVVVKAAPVVVKATAKAPTVVKAAAAAPAATPAEDDDLAALLSKLEAEDV